MSESNQVARRWLILMRHAKSSWAENGISDHERPLNARGRRAAVKMAEFLRQDDSLPDHALLSSAVRCQETWERMRATVTWPCETVTTQKLYLAPAKQMLEIVRRRGQTAQHLLVLGHNPGLHEWVQHWLPVVDRFPTAAVARFAFEIESWDSLTWQSRPVAANWQRPKALGEE